MTLVNDYHAERGCSGCFGLQFKCGDSVHCVKDTHECTNRDWSTAALSLMGAVLVGAAILVWRGNL